MSNSIRELEEELGISLFYVPIRALFNRRRNGFRTSRESLSSNGVIGKSLSRDSDQRTILHLFATLRFLGEVIAKVLKKYGDQYKDFRVFETTTLKVIEDVKGFHSELGIIYLNEQNSVSIERYLEQANLAYEVISTFNTHIFRKSSSFSQAKEIHLEELVPIHKFALIKKEAIFPIFLKI